VNPEHSSAAAGLACLLAACLDEAFGMAGRL